MGLKHHPNMWNGRCYAEPFWRERPLFDDAWGEQCNGSFNIPLAHWLARPERRPQWKQQQVRAR